MEVILWIIISLLGVVAYINISNNIKQKYKELGIMLSFGMPKEYFFAFYTTKAFLLVIISIVVTVMAFNVIEFFFLDPYLKTELFNNVLAIAKTEFNKTTSLSLPILNQVLIFGMGTLVTIVLFLISLSLVIFKMPSELIKE